LLPEKRSLKQKYPTAQETVAMCMLTVKEYVVFSNKEKKIFFTFHNFNTFKVVNSEINIRIY
jgi:hypothetical protein